MCVCTVFFFVVRSFGIRLVLLAIKAPFVVCVYIYFTRTTKRKWFQVRNEAIQWLRPRLEVIEWNITTKINQIQLHSRIHSQVYISELNGRNQVKVKTMKQFNYETETNQPNHITNYQKIDGIFHSTFHHDLCCCCCFCFFLWSVKKNRFVYISVDCFKSNALINKI